MRKSVHLVGHSHVYIFLIFMYIMCLCIKFRKDNWTGNVLHGNCLPLHVIEAKTEEKRRKSTQAATRQPSGKEKILEFPQ